MKIIIKTLQGKQLPVEVEETFTVSRRRGVNDKESDGITNKVIVVFVGQTNQGKD